MRDARSNRAGRSERTSGPTRRRARLGIGVLLAACVAVGCASLSKNTAGDEPASGIVAWRDLPFADRDGDVLAADVYRRPGGPRPAVVIIHPGGWVMGDKSHVARIAGRMAAAGYVAVAPAYRLAPQHRFPAQLHDVKEAVRWIRANAPRLGVDPERIAAYGYSSGGHLAALLATTGPEDGLEGPTAYPGRSSRVQALVAGGSPTDLRGLRGNPVVPELLGGTPLERPGLAADASPVRFASSDDPPTFLFHGRLDFFVLPGQSRRFSQALETAGVAVELDLPFLGHFSTWLWGSRQLERAVGFLDRRFESAPRLASQDSRG